MSIGSSVQQVSGGIAAILAGAIVIEREGGVLERFEMFGYGVVDANFLSIVLIYRIHLLVTQPRLGGL